MPKPTDIRVVGARLYFLPVRTRLPLKFGAETLTEVTCARVSVKVLDRIGRVAEGWGETPLSVQWTWPSSISYSERHERLKKFCETLVEAWTNFDQAGHPIEIGYDFQEQILPTLLNEANQSPESTEPIPWLAALLCCSAFDIAIHDAFGQLLQRNVYQTYGAEFCNRDLSHFFGPKNGAPICFDGKFLADFLVTKPPTKLLAWHLVGGLDLLDSSESTGDEPQDGYPVLLTDWIQRDGLKCLKIKLRGNDAPWDYERMVRVGEIGIQHGVEHLTADYNCMVTDPGYVNETLDRLRSEHPRIYEKILYVEQPFPYELERNRIDVHSVSSRKPLFLDESAHDWRFVRLGRELGWTGVALKTCKTQTGALLSCCWAKAHGMLLMAQDLSNPMLAQIPHVQLAAHVSTIMGVETNGMQFYPEASRPEAKIHPGVYQRRDGRIDLSTLNGPGFGYCLEKIKRQLPPAVQEFEALR
ncbi:MAG: mandelate racemase/muconate lactonizing enzyme family protein [Verrucomicrobiota bacterium]